MALPARLIVFRTRAALSTRSRRRRVLFVFCKISIAPTLIENQEIKRRVTTCRGKNPITQEAVKEWSTNSQILCLPHVLGGNVLEVDAVVGVLERERLAFLAGFTHELEQNAVELVSRHIGEDTPIKLFFHGFKLA